jgi:type II secretory ATPase GspE/PulE/Tfp pilus assembly ATPase PilB-like protein
VALSSQPVRAVPSIAGELQPDAEALRYIPAGFAYRHNVLACGVSGSELIVAVPDLESSTIDRIRLLTGMRVRAIPAQRDLIRRHLTAAYSVDASALAIAEDLETSAPAIRIVDEIHETAIRRGASDVHLEPIGRAGRVRCRIDGRLRVTRTLDAEMYPQVVSRIKVLAGLDVADRRQPQDGRYTFEDGGRPIDVRVSSMATIAGERAVLRLFDSRAQKPDLNALGMDPETIARARSLIQAPHGFVAVCGPTGSGKTTTLYAALRERRSDQEHLCTIEDPVEMRLEGVAQVQINSRAGLTFSRALRAVLRADPNVVMIGEMRDSETADAAISAALAGQLVLASLHSFDAMRAIDRLLDLKIPRHAIASALTGIISQRLVRTVCARCGDANGCDDCGGTGLSGRTGIFECVAVSDELRMTIARGMPLQEVRRLVERDAAGSLERDALRHVVAGRTTASEAARVLGERR